MLYSTYQAGLRSSAVFFNDTATTEIYTLSLHDALPISCRRAMTSALLCGTANSINSRIGRNWLPSSASSEGTGKRSEEHTSELQSRPHLVCRLLLEKKKQNRTTTYCRLMHKER